MEEDLPQQPKPSPAASWATLGFLMGALVVLAIPRHREEAATRVVPAETALAKPVPPPQPQITTIEAVFALYGKDAVWDNNVTEVAMWNTTTKGYTDFYEAVRLGDDVYFRSISRLTRPVLTHGVAMNLPLRFTETAEQRAQWLRESNR